MLHVHVHYNVYQSASKITAHYKWVVHVLQKGASKEPSGVVMHRL